MSTSQVELAKKIGVSPAQLYKYEAGLNKISAGKLYDIAISLNSPIWYFFDLESNKFDLDIKNAYFNLTEDEPNLLINNLIEDKHNNLTVEEMQYVKKEYDQITEEASRYRLSS
jgi:transcriptional regulator with XRE-family HTH domain